MRQAARPAMAAALAATLVLLVAKPLLQDAADPRAPLWRLRLPSPGSTLATPASRTAAEGMSVWLYPAFGPANGDAEHP